MDKKILDYEPRSYQKKLLDALESGAKRAVCVWHRRAGKDVTAWSWLITEALLRPGVYYYITPTYAQGKKILWNGIDGMGRRFLSYVPEQQIITCHETEMYMKLRTIDGRESLFQVIGSDNIDSIVGTNPRVCVFSEYSLQSPRGWDFLRPILRENKGVAIFLYTPRGRNHGWRLYEDGKAAGWYTDFRTVRDTVRDAPYEKGGFVITEDEIEEDLRTGMDPDLIQQEYYCSFQGAQEGAYFGYLVEQAYREERITLDLPVLEKVPVHTAWDIGMDDETAIWFWQHRGAGQVNMIDYWEGRNKSLQEIVNEIYRKPYLFTGNHSFPWDIEVREWAGGQKRKVIARDLLGKIKVAPKLRPEDRIEAARRHFHKVWFHRDRCAQGLSALAGYKREKDEKANTFKNIPLHDWACHGADAFQVHALTFRPEQTTPVQTRAVDDFDPFTYEKQSSYQYDHDPYTKEKVGWDL